MRVPPMGGVTDLLYVEGLRSTGVQFRGSLSTGVSSPTVGTAEGTLLPFPEKKPTFFVAPAQDT